MIKVNGQEEVLAENLTIQDYISGTATGQIALPWKETESSCQKREYADTVLEDGDHIEIVSFVGGG